MTKDAQKDGFLHFTGFSAELSEVLEELGEQHFRGCDVQSSRVSFLEVIENHFSFSKAVPVQILSMPIN